MALIRWRRLEKRERGNDPLGTQMVWDILSWLLFIIFIAGLIVVGGLLLKGYLAQGSNAGGGFSGGFFGPKPDKRLEVVDQANVDGRRRLVLLRRDEVEHLIMTGGPVDVVIETGIEGAAPRAAAPRAAAPASFERIDNDTGDGEEKPASFLNRPARVFGKSAGDA